MSAPPRPVTKSLVNDKRLKKDALWKPLLRHFRQYIRVNLANHVDINNIFEDSGDIKDTALAGCQAFLEEVQAPDQVFQNLYKYQLSLIVLLAPSQASNLPVFFLRCPQIKMQLKELQPLFCTVFRENSIKLRRRLFQEPLMRHLWNKFRDSSASII